MRQQGAFGGAMCQEGVMYALEFDMHRKDRAL